MSIIISISIVLNGVKESSSAVSHSKSGTIPTKFQTLCCPPKYKLYANSS